MKFRKPLDMCVRARVIQVEEAVDHADNNQELIKPKPQGDNKQDTS